MLNIIPRNIPVDSEDYRKGYCRTHVVYIIPYTIISRARSLHDRNGQLSPICLPVWKLRDRVRAARDNALRGSHKAVLLEIGKGIFSRPRGTLIKNLLYFA